MYVNSPRKKKSRHNNPPSDKLPPPSRAPKFALPNASSPLSKPHLSSSQNSYLSPLFSHSSLLLPPTWPSPPPPPPLSMSLFSLLPLLLLPPLLSAAPTDLCGNLSLPFPFHLNSSPRPQLAAFRLTCPHNSSLHLTQSLSNFRILSFLTPSSILLDYSISNSKWYADLNRFSQLLNQSDAFAVTPDNVLRLYDCDDSSVCRTGCGREGCCYPLWDGSVWKAGEGFGVFGEYGCRGFSSWVEKRGSGGDGRRGIEVEWAVPRGLAGDVGCADGAAIVNATAVGNGFRCACGQGLLGDGFAQGIGCFKGDICMFFKQNETGQSYSIYVYRS